MKKRTRRVIITLVLIVLLTGVAAAAGVWYLLNAPYKSFTEARVAVNVPEGSTVNSIAQRLWKKGVIRHPLLLKGIFIFKKTQKESKAGDYVFDRALTPFQVYEKLMKGEMYFDVYTVPEGSSVFDIDGLWRMKQPNDAEAFKQAIASPEVQTELHSIDSNAKSAEGFLFPDTYYIGKNDGAKKLVLLMLKQFRKNYGPREAQRAKEIGLSNIQVITLASLIEKETGKSSERPLISGVFHNRLQRSMLLQCDPTVIYAMKLAGEYDGKIRTRDLQRPSPYNTYVSPGLPPGPICNPGRESIQAALYPENTNMLYFVSKNDGSHYFSASLQEHIRAVQQYQRR